MKPAPPPYSSHSQEQVPAQRWHPSGYPMAPVPASPPTITNSSNSMSQSLYSSGSTSIIQTTTLQHFSSSLPGLEPFDHAPTISINKLDRENTSYFTINVHTQIHSQQQVPLKLTTSIPSGGFTHTTNQVLHYATFGGIRNKTSIILESASKVPLIKIQRKAFQGTNEFLIKSPHNSNVVLGYIQVVNKGIALDYMIFDKNRKPQVKFVLSKINYMYNKKGVFFNMSGVEIATFDVRTGLVSFKAVFPADGGLKALTAMAALIQKFN